MSSRCTLFGWFTTISPNSQFALRTVYIKYNTFYISALTYLIIWPLSLMTSHLVLSKTQVAAVQNVKFITTQRGGDTLVIDNYMFRVRTRLGLLV